MDLVGFKVNKTRSILNQVAFFFRHIYLFMIGALISLISLDGASSFIINNLFASYQHGLGTD